MTDEQLLRLLGYLGVVREALRMQNWDVVLHRTPHGLEDTWAHTWTADNHYVINIEICPELLKERPGQIRNAIVHELIHAQHRNVDLIWEGCTQNNDDVPKSQAESWDKDYRMEMERFVSWTTKQIENYVPMYSRRTKYVVAEGCSLNGKA